MPADARSARRRRQSPSSSSERSGGSHHRRRRRRSPLRIRSRSRSRRHGRAPEKGAGKHQKESEKPLGGFDQRSNGGGFAPSAAVWPAAGRNREQWAAVFAGQTQAAMVAAIAPKPVRAASGIDFAQVRQLKQKIEEEKSKVLEDMIRLKHEQADLPETSETSAERQKEYFSAPPGTACGPGGRFIVQTELGRGMFSSVYHCKDAEKSDIEYAVKFTRRNKTLRKATEREVELLGKLCRDSAESDPEGAKHLLGLAFFEGFEHEGHLAVVLELMKCDLRTATKKYGQGKGLPLLPTVRDFARQLFLALRALHRAEIIHCDIKPENLLLSLDRETIKLSDFGSAISMDERIRTDYMQPRNYRAPEVILGQSYSSQIDIWSAGVTVFELATDQTIFKGKTNNDMLHSMMQVLGAFPRHFASSGEFSAKHFKSDGLGFLHANADFGSSSGVLTPSSFKGPLRPLAEVLGENLQTPPRGVPEERHRGMVRHLEDLLLQGCLVPVPARRATAEKILAHRFFQKGAS